MPDKQLRLLCVTAHPDDEAGGFGGTLQLYRDRGVATYVVCLTAGTAGSHRGAAKSDAELAAIRRAEFEASCKLLRVSHAEVLEYPDGGLNQVPFLDPVGAITRRIRQVRPQVVMTFGHEGAVTAHPDHTMVSLFTAAAFQWAARTDRFPEQLEKEGLQSYRAQKLYYATAAFSLPERQPIAPPPSTAIVDVGPYIDTKLAAFKLHGSQEPLFGIFEHIVRLRSGRERFNLAACSTPRDIAIEDDLFAGVTP
jgi:LmbE family N-acetylglucosaminyl deacetylase